MNERIIISGGQENNESTSQIVVNTVQQFSLLPSKENSTDQGHEALTWNDMPVLNVARKEHSSCTVERTVYVFCGVAGDRH